MTVSTGTFRETAMEAACGLLVAGALLAAPAGCRREAPDPGAAAGPDGDAWFEQVGADTTGIDIRHTSGAGGHFWLPEIATGGVGLLDYDGDGLLDVYFVQGGSLDPAAGDPPGNRLYRNRGDWTFEDVTAAAGVGDTGYGMGCCAGDFNGDGHADLYVTNLGPNVLYRNNGDGTFTDVSDAAGVADASWGTSCAFVDYDRDGDEDLVVINYVNWSPERELQCFSQAARDYCSPKNYRAPAPDTLYRNEGDGTFADVSGRAGLDHAFGNGFGIACGDWNMDGWLDIYVANDGTPNQLWISDGAGGFTDRADLAGCALNRYGHAEAGMGVAALDADNDGDLDLFLSHLEDETNTFYLNDHGTFEDYSAEVGLGAASHGFTGFGLGFADFDHDGWLDVYVANGRVRRTGALLDPNDPYAEPDQLFRGTATGRFEEVKPRGGTTPVRVAAGRAAAFGDLDNDGDVDIVVANKDGPPHLLRNIVGDRGHWVSLRVLNRDGRDAIGAMVRIESGGRVMWRLVQRAYSYCATDDPRVHFGLGPASTIDSVTVHWLGGGVEDFGALQADREQVITQGSGRPTRDP